MREIKILDVFDASVAYVYIWLSKNKKCIYVGQTNGDGGVLGRAADHVKITGTLRKRYYESFAERLEDASDWVLFSFCLPTKKNYTSAESSFRRAVEYLVQVGLHEKRGDMSPPFKIISSIDYSDYCRVAEVKNISKEIIEAFINEYSKS